MQKLRTRVIPCLLLRNESLVKTIRFDKYTYVGDPINTVRIFNELEVDELIFLDIMASRTNQDPSYKILKNIANECFMPLAYGGGIRSFDQAKRIFDIGFEKIVLNSALFSDPDLIRQIVEVYGSQSVIGSVDYRKNFFGKTFVYSNSGTKNEKWDPSEWAYELERRGVGEVILTSMDRDGTWEGYDVPTIEKTAQKLSIPLIASGGAGHLSHLKSAVKSGRASALALGSMVIFQKKGMGVLVNFPDKQKLREELG